MATLDPELHVLLSRKDISADKPIFISLKFSGNIAALVSAPFTVGSVIGPIAFGQTTLAGLKVLAEHPQVEAIEKQRLQGLGLDRSVPNIKADQVWSRSGDDFKGYTGRGVIVGIVDTGIDFRHQAFRKADGTSRVLNVWDQTLNAQGGETVPAAISTPSSHTLGYGVEYTRQQINDTLTSSSPTISVRHVDEDGHGTHVAGIAAGDGSQSGRCHGAYHYIGVAPDADIIMVRRWGLSDSDKQRTAPATSSSFQLDAIAYIMNRARQLSTTQPVVINLSQWSYSELLDGNSSSCQAVDSLLTNNSAGTAIVFITGNGAEMSFHAVGTVPAGPSDTFALPFRVADNDTKPRNIAVLYTGTNLKARVTSPVSGASGITAWVAQGAAATPNTTANGTGGSVTITNIANKITITITPPPGTPAGTGTNVAGSWLLELQDAGSSATALNAFCLYGSHDPKRHRFLDHVSVQLTLSPDSSGRECISVGNYQLTDPLALAASSGRGPTLDGRTKPDVCAPGTGIVSAAVVKESERSACARCCCDCCDDVFYVPKSGTSMAAPHVTGLIALMLHKNPTLTHAQIKQFLTQNSHANSPTDPPDDNAGWGAGSVDAQATVGSPSIAAVNAPVAREALAPEPLAALHATLRDTRRGPTLEKLFETYGSEVWALIQHNRKVAAIWHRCKGPIWVRFALRAAHEPQRPVPFEADGVALTDALRRFGLALKRYGSQPLRNDVEAWEGEFVLVRDGMSLNEIITTIGNHSAAKIAAAPA
jgi:subtilisin family serine protease